MIQRLRPVLLLPVLAVIAGCSTATSHIATQVTPAATSALNGSVHGGQQPIVGATIQLYAVGTTGDGSAATPLLSPALTTDASGGFDLTNKFTCPTSASLVYLVATGGNPGLPPPATNQQSALIVALGPCGNPTGINFISVNEVTTVAAVYALAPFMIDITDIGSGSSSSDVQALSDAFTLAWEFANPTTGTSPGSNVPPGTTIPTAQINTLANLISNCVNSAGGVSGDPSICGQLFLLTTPGGGTPATDTITALLHLALNPGLNTQALYDLILPTAPFQPTITQQPPDFGVRPTIPSDFTVSPSSLDFGSILVGEITPTQAITIANNTARPFLITSADFIGIDPGDFFVKSYPSSCSSIMGPGTSCTYLIAFNPTAAGARQAYFAVKNNSPNPLLTVSLSGVGAVGTAGPITVSPSSLNFSLVNTPQMVTLANAGNTTLNIQAITIDSSLRGVPGPFIETDNCGTSLPAQSVCMIAVSAHNYSGEPNAVLNIRDDATDGPQSVSLNKTSAAGAVIVPDSISFGVQPMGTESTPYMIQTFIFPVDTVVFSIIGPNASDFSFTSGSNTSTYTCVNGRIRGSSCVPPLYFKPSGPGPRTAMISVPNTGNILLTGTGVGSGPYFVADVSNFSMFSYIGTPSTQTIPVHSTGAVAIDIGPPAVTVPAGHASEFTTASTCQNVAPGRTCTLTVTYTPTLLSENFNGSILITDATNTVQQAASFTAISSDQTTPPSSTLLTFGSTLAGTLSAPQSVTATAYFNDPVNVTVVGAFQITQGATCAATPCQVSVVFAPPANASPGVMNGFLTIKDPYINTSTNVYLRGTAFNQTTTSVSPGSLTFPLRSASTTSIPQTITVTNTGATNALIVSSVTATGPNPGDYILTNNCTTNVTPGNSCTINVSFSPTATGTRTANVQIVSNSTTTPDTVTLSGTAQ
jgi:hypothetical protein